MVLSLLQKLYRENQLNSEELLFLLTHMDAADRGKLYELSHRTALRVFGRNVYLRALIEFSNVCRRNCRYCGIRAQNSGVSRYRMTPQEIIDCCGRAYALGFRTFVLQSGEDPWFTERRVTELVASIRRRFPDAAITLSIGERSTSEYEAFFEAGADRFLMRHETASPWLYKELHPDMTMENRRRCLQDLKRIGYQVGAGFMVGLPGQRPEDLVNDLLFLKDFEPDMVGIGPFIPHSQTPLASSTGGTLEDSLVMVAVTRLLLPECLLPATTALGTLHPIGREKALAAGANVLMPNVSPVEVRPKYQLYENKICVDEDFEHCQSCLRWRIESVDLDVDMSRGDSPASRHLFKSPHEIQGLHAGSKFTQGSEEHATNAVSAAGVSEAGQSSTGAGARYLP